MRTTLVGTLLAITACGNDSKPDVDAQNGNHPPPRVIPGGGIGDGAIDGVVNLYVIDDSSRKPIAGASVRVGTIDGTTDADGLFVANDVTGPQTVTAKASSYRAEVWTGANGANITLSLQKANGNSVDSANLAGQITNWAAGVTVAAGHAKVGLVAYSQSDDLGDAANQITQPNNQNLCITLAPTDPCNFTITSRTGKVALIAAVFDRDLKGTPNNPDDDTMTLINWAVRPAVTVTAGANQTALDLTLLNAATDLQTESIDFGSPPAALSTVGGMIGIEIGDAGVFQLGMFSTPTNNTLKVPKLSTITGATGYRLTGIANNGAATNLAQSVVLRRDQPGQTLQAGMWLPPPTGVSLSRTSGSWTNAVGATVHGVEITQGATKIVSITNMDNSSMLNVPSLITLPSGALTAHVQGIGAPNLDVTNFSLDADRGKLVMVGGQDTTIN
jgi:hypothetical protein